MFFMGRDKGLKNEELVKVQDKSTDKIQKLKNLQEYQIKFSERILNESYETLESAEKLLKSVEEINNAIDLNEKNIIKTLKVSDEVGEFSNVVFNQVDQTIEEINSTLEKSEAGCEAVQLSINSIETIKEIVESMEQVILELIEKSDKINGIVDTIKNIAKTTHLLSLNANIEAARAGEAGRSFAIVAGEVKKLADNSSKSADEIGNIIKDIGSTANKTTEFVKNSIDRVMKSIEEAKKAGDAINEIIESANRTQSISMEIGKATKFQTKKNQDLLSVVQDMTKESQGLKTHNENISIDAFRQRSSLNKLKESILTLNDISNSMKGIIEEGYKMNHRVKNTLRIQVGNIETFDPAKVLKINNIISINSMHMGLVQFGYGIDVVGGIAKSWHLEGDNVTWSFNLRNNVKFHNGRIVTAYDVKYSFERFLSRELNSQNRWFLNMIKGAEEFYVGREREIRGIVVDGDFSIKIILEKPYISFVNNLAFISCSIIPKECINYINERPIGAGPYKFVSYDKDKKELILEKFEEYKLGEPLMDRIEIVADENDRIEEFSNGNLEYIPVNVLNIDILKERGYKLFKEETLTLKYIAFNFESKNPIIKNKYARQAINYIIDRELIVSEGLKNLENPSKYLFPKGAFTNEKVRIERDKNKAKELMKRSGITSGTLTFILKESLKERCYFKMLIKVLSENLKEIGIMLKVNTVRQEDITKERLKNNWDLMYIGWVGDTGTADNFIEPFIQENGLANVGHYINYELINQMRCLKTIKNPYKYDEKLSEIEDIFLEEMPYISLSVGCSCYACKENIKGIKIHPTTLIKFQDIWKE